MSFRYRDTVEIIKKREGFSADAYYLQATFMAFTGATQCLVQYHTRYDEDGTRLKTEAVEEELVRPVPPLPQAQASTSCSRERWNYVVSQKVDAYDNGAWWVGRVSRVDEDDALNCYVRLDISGSEIKLPFFRVRNHLDWRDRQWVSPAPSRAPRPRSPSTSSDD